MIASNRRPAASQSSNFAVSTAIPVDRAYLAIRSSTSTPSTWQPASRNWRATIPVPTPTSSTARPGLRATIRSISSTG